MDRYRTTEKRPVSLHRRSVASRTVTPTNAKSLAAKYASLTRSRTDDDPELVEVRSALARERIRKQINDAGTYLLNSDRVALAQDLLTGAAGS